MSSLRQFLTALSCSCLLLCTAAPASAQVVRYGYSGNAFATATPGFGLSHVSLWLEVESARLTPSSHVALDSFNTGGLRAFAFSDGHNTISNDPFDGFSVYSSARVSFDTDAAGQFAGHWDAWASRAHGNQEGLILSDSIHTTSLRSGGQGGQPLMQDGASSLSTYTAVLLDNPGTWSTMPGVPEPQSLQLMVLGLLLAPVARRLHRRQSVRWA